MKKYKNYKLCYLKDGVAHFTRKELHEQWGDDWDDVPYEHNAGEPYYDDKDDILRVYFEAWEYKEPQEDFYNSPYSVMAINNKEVPWLRARFFESKLEPIYAGCSIEKFIKLIEKAKGEVFVPLKLVKTIKVI